MVSRSYFVASGLPAALERVPIKWNHLIDEYSLKFKELEQVLVEKSRATFSGHALAAPAASPGGSAARHLVRR